MLSSMFNYFMNSLLILILTVTTSNGLRCYVDLAVTKSISIECGFSSGCVKIYIDTEEMMLRKQAEEGINTLPERYLGNPVLRRGCFVLAVPDRCYTAKNGISYCWCSGKDLCNSARSNYCFQFIPNFFLILFWIIVLFR